MIAPIKRYQYQSERKQITVHARRNNQSNSVLNAADDAMDSGHHNNQQNINGWLIVVLYLCPRQSLNLNNVLQTQAQ